MEGNDEDNDLTDEESLIDDLSSVKPKGKKHKFEAKQFVRWKFRFEWMTNQEFDPWWESPVDMKIMNPSFSDPLGYSLCLVCNQYSFRFYKVWICLNHSCKAFFRVRNVIFLVHGFFSYICGFQI